MNNPLFSLLILVNLSTHIFAMDELFDADQKQNLKDLITEYQTPIVAGSIIGCGAAVSLYKWDKRPIIISSALAGGYLVYKWLEDQENDERTQRINALKKQYGIIDSSISEITDDLTQIRSNVINIRENIAKSVITLENIENDFAESGDEMKLTNDSAKRTALLLAESIEKNKSIHSNITTLIQEQNQLSTLISKSHATIQNTDTANSDKILKAITASSFETDFSSIAAGQ